MQKKNKVSGNLVGRDINYNYNYLLKNEGDIFDSFKKISEEVNKKLPKGVYNYYKERFEKYCSLTLFQSLVEIAIPAVVAYTVVEKIPEFIDQEISELKDEVFSTRNIRHITSSLFKKIDYAKLGLPNLKQWGENYIRKYGHSDRDLQVLLDEEKRYEILDRKFIEKKLLPDLYFKCYGSNLAEDLKLLKSKKLLGDISSEIIEKVRLLNLYTIRYSTLRKLTYDFAIQPPHHWFTDKPFLSKHIEYNLEKLKKNRTLFIKGIDTSHSAKEFIEHSCAIILSLYSLFIGIGKLRPLISLLNYFILKDANHSFWESIQLSNLPDDLLATDNNINFYRLKYTLEQIKHKIHNVNEEYSSLLNDFEMLYNVIESLIVLHNQLNNFELKYVDIDTFKQKALFLLKYYGNIKIDTEYFFREEFKYIPIPESMFSIIKLGFLFITSNNKILHIKHRRIKSSNSLLLISNIKTSNNDLHEVLKKHRIREAFIFTLTLEEIFNITKSLNRGMKLEFAFHDSLL